VESSTAFGCIGEELVTLLQVLFFLVLGYAAARKLRAVFPRTVQVAVKIIDDVDTLPQGDAACEESDMVVQAPRSAKSRHSNAAERKRMRKASQSDSKKLAKEVAEKPCFQGAADVTEVVEEILETALVLEETPVQVVSYEASPANQRTSNIMLKKAARKARKLQQQNEVVEEQLQDQKVSPLDNTEKFDSDVLSQDDPLAAISPTASTVSMASGGADMSGSDVSPGARTPDSAHSEPSEPVNASLTVETLANHCIAAVEAQERESLGEASGVLGGAAPESKQFVPCTNINFDDIESDTDSDVDMADHASNSIPMVDASQTRPEIAPAPIMWCNPDMVDESQIEGWVAVSVPVECAPAGAFDGLWTNGADEKILVEQLEIMFESGVSWTMEMHSLSCISVTLDGEQLFAELDSTGKQLVWTDGDVWLFHGRADSDCAPEAGPEMMMPMMSPREYPCMMMPMVTENLPVQEEVPMLPFFQCTEEMQMFSTFECTECVQSMPQPEKWETCWDWEKKGHCPRGMNCEWYHPTAQASFAEGDLF